MRARLQALRSVSSLPPIAVAVCELGDLILRDLVAEVAEEALRKATPLVPCAEEMQPLLEGAMGTLPGDGSKISASLHGVLVQEAMVTERSSKRARACLGDDEVRKSSTAQGLDVFGNRPKEKANAETIVCTNCAIQLSASRFAPHLERCLLGKGRKRTSVQGGNGS